MSQKLQELQDNVNAWADRTFGTEIDVDKLVDHIIEELEDLRDDPYDPVNFADVLILFVRIAKNAELTMDELLEVCDAKLVINATQREWNTEPGESRRYRQIG